MRRFSVLLLFIFLSIFSWAIIYFFFSPILCKYEASLFTTRLDLQFVYYRYQDRDEIVSGFVSYLEGLGKVFSSYDEGSELSYVNRFGYGRGVELSEGLFFLIERGLYYGDLSSGVFDISILPLIRLWGVSDSGSRGVPAGVEVEAALSRVNYRDIELKGRSLRFLKEGMSISLGGISKGYIIDKGIEYLRGEGIEDALVNIGGDMRAMGRTIYGEDWRVAIRNPRVRGSYLGLVSLYDASLATSGDYERYRITDGGERVSHIIDPRTGYPVRGVLSVSILSSSALVSDVVATIVFVLGPYEGFNFLGGLDGVEGFIVFDKSVFSSGLSIGSGSLGEDIHFLATGGFVLGDISE